MTERPAVLRLCDVAARYGKTVPTIRAWAKAGKIPHLRLPGGEYRFSAEDIAEFESQCRVASSTDQTTDSISGEGAGSSTTPTGPLAAPGPFQRGRLSVVQPRSGRTNG